eukprot:7510611-Karenia_brevis.AAC.1
MLPMLPKKELLAQQHCVEAEDAVFTTAARAVLNQDHGLASSLWKRHPQAGQYIGVDAQKNL